MTQEEMLMQGLEGIALFCSYCFIPVIFMKICEHCERLNKERI